MSLASEYARIPFAGAVHDFSVPMRERAAGRRMCGPYYMRPREHATGVGLYMESGPGLAMARHGAGIRLRVDYVPNRWRERAAFYTDSDGGGDLMFPMVARLPRGRGFLAGWTLGPGMCGAVDRTIWPDLESAERAAVDLAERESLDWIEQGERDREERDAEEAAEEAAAALEASRPDLYASA